LWQGGTGRHRLHRLHTEGIAKKNWTLIAPRYIIQKYLYVANSFYDTPKAASAILHLLFDVPHGVNALPLVDHEFAFLDADGLVFLLCNVPLSLEQCHYK
jgi:hypothetical protein